MVRASGASLAPHGPTTYALDPNLATRWPCCPLTAVAFHPGRAVPVSKTEAKLVDRWEQRLGAGAHNHCTGVVTFQGRQLLLLCPPQWLSCGRGFQLLQLQADLLPGRVQAHSVPVLACAELRMLRCSLPVLPRRSNAGPAAAPQGPVRQSLAQSRPPIGTAWAAAVAIVVLAAKAAAAPLPRCQRRPASFERRLRNERRRLPQRWLPATQCANSCLSLSVQFPPC